ncbi:hypothetical protein GC425_07505 [Corynebacterium sp. zg254]|uniref:Alpha/beta hydrolase n=1 Tax=Corynebacterium zhongnanshanii TaxID=2768834 RepID=A0ABQ6VDX1_9CORY|nr:MULTISPECIES: hypothetical protein [Corynebacterium]KAB3521058.1 hypothetical protein F8377_07540 [Corynebacterium zhongnanshanii]MCR5914701.1 hypothetical protein [Corynebacterium sp. zg254]
MSLDHTPNSDIANLPNSGKDVQEGVEPLTAHQQIAQLNDYFEDNYPEVFTALTQDEGAPYRDAGMAVPAELVESTERQWARAVDLISHSSLLVLGAGLDHRMPHNAFISAGQVSADAQPSFATDLPEGVSATAIRPANPDGSVAISLHGGPGWFGDGESHDLFWLPLFASVAAQSGTTIVDLTYPLPGYGAWDATQAAVAGAWDVVRQAFPGEKVGVVAFGSGLIAAAQVLEQADFLLAMTPRIPEGFQVDLTGVPTLVTVADSDSRGTSAKVCRQWAEKSGASLTYQEWPSEHIIAAPSVWRERVTAAGQWLKDLLG